MDRTRSLRTDPRSPRQIAILLYPGVQSLDFAGPLEVFSGAQRLIEESGRHERGYEVRLLGLDDRPLRTSSGLTVTPHASLEDAPAEIDTLIVPGGYGSREAATDPALLRWISRAAASSRRTASVCTGAFLLAAAGLLDGRRATTHWASAAELAAGYPAVEVDPEPIFLRDGPIWTSAGVTAGMDLALALVEEDLDRAAALQIARHLVLFLRRPGSQSQFSATLSAQEPEREPLREVQRHVVEHPADDLSVEALAARAHMSPRNFARAFAAETRVDACALRRASAPRGRPSMPGGHRGADRGGRRQPAASAPPRRCAGRFSARSTSGRRSTAVASMHSTEKEMVK